jgi:peptidoglycan/LPS O-acetylase OafA/YrhL
MLVILLTVLASYYIQNFVQYAKVAQDGRWAALFAANIHFAEVGTGYFQQSVAPSPLEHYWSLGVEEQFYLMWPALILLVSALFTRIPLRWRITTLAVVATTASFVWSEIQTTSNPTWAYFSPLTRGWELGIGAVAATLIPQLARMPKVAGMTIAYCGLAAIVISALWYTSATPYPGTAALLPVLGATAVIVGGASGTGARHLLGQRPARSVGRVSFGWYLLHYPPMIILTGALWVHPLSVQENLIIGAVTLVVAYGMYAAIETPIRRSPFLAYRQWLSISLGGALVVGVFLFCLFLHPSIHSLWQL